jgi:hypothetical protein
MNSYILVLILTLSHPGQEDAPPLVRAVEQIKHSSATSCELTARYIANKFTRGRYPLTRRAQWQCLRVKI